MYVAATAILSLTAVGMSCCTCVSELMCGAAAGLVVVVHHSIRPSGRLFEWCDVRLPARRRVACASRETAHVGLLS